jgi:hypothetical protein
VAILIALLHQDSITKLQPHPRSLDAEAGMSPPAQPRAGLRIRGGAWPALKLDPRP